MTLFLMWNSKEMLGTMTDWQSRSPFTFIAETCHSAYHLFCAQVVAEERDTWIGPHDFISVFATP